MSYAADGYYAENTAPLAPAPSVAPQERSIIRPLLFFGPIVLSGLSYAMGGIGPLTDLSFLLLTALCLYFVIVELIHFPERQGIGSLLIYGGVLVWFCHDYMFNWLGLNFADSQSGIPVHVVAKAAFYHMIFIDIMIIVMGYPILRWVEKLVIIVPEPANPRFYVLVLILIECVGFLPFFVFVNEPFYSAIFKTATFQEDEVKWTVGRTMIGHAANLNYEWGGYVVQILQVGTVGGILGAAYAILVARSWMGKLFGWAIWYYWVAYSFPTFRRGDMAFVIMPVVGLLFYKYQVLATSYLRRVGWKAYALGGIAAIGLYVVVQYQGSTRANVSLDVVSARGNTMFSEGMKAWAIFGESSGSRFYLDTFPGATFILPLPVTLYWFVIDPIPRALWTTKPVDQFDSWYNDLMTGEHAGATGTTVSAGAVGAWYFRYGPVGVIEGAILYGWLMGLAERALHRANGRPMAVLFSLCFAVFMFRCYRDLWFHSLYPLMIGAAVLYVIVKFVAGGHADAPGAQVPAAIQAEAY